MAKQLFFLSGILLFLSQYFFLYINDFLMIEKQSVFQSFASVTQRKRNKKRDFSAIFFVLKFSKFLEIRIQVLRSQYQLDQMFLNNIITSQITTVFYSNFDTLLYKFEACRCKAITTGTLLDVYLQRHKVLLSKSEGILSYMGL